MFKIFFVSIFAFSFHLSLANKGLPDESDWLINPSSWIRKEAPADFLTAILDHPVTRSLDSGRKHIEKSPSFFAGLAQGAAFFLGTIGIVSIVETFSNVKDDEKDVLIKLSAFYPITRMAFSSKKSWRKNLGLILGYALMYDLVLLPDYDYNHLKIGPGGINAELDK